MRGCITLVIFPITFKSVEYTHTFAICHPHRYISIYGQYLVQPLSYVCFKTTFLSTVTITLNGTNQQIKMLDEENEKKNNPCDIRLQRIQWGYFQVNGKHRDTWNQLFNKDCVKWLCVFYANDILLLVSLFKLKTILAWRSQGRSLLTLWIFRLCDSARTHYNLGALKSEFHSLAIPITIPILGFLYLLCFFVAFFFLSSFERWSKNGHTIPNDKRNFFHWNCQPKNPKIIWPRMSGNVMAHINMCHINC